MNRLSNRLGMFSLLCSPKIFVGFGLGVGGVLCPLHHTTLYTLWPVGSGIVVMLAVVQCRKIRVSQPVGV